MTKLKPVPIASIVIDAGTQVRAEINEATVAEYAEAMSDPANLFPPIVVFVDGTRLLLADGFHRVLAATRNGQDRIEAEIHKGTKQDALKYALGANTSHGLPRSNADKRKSVEMALTEWPKLSDRELARLCAVSHPFVAGIRQANQLVTVTSSRVGADGKTRTVKPPAPIAEPTTHEPEDDPFCRESSDEDRPRVVAGAPESNWEPLIEEIDVAMEDLKVAMDAARHHDIDRATVDAVRTELLKLCRILAKFEEQL